MNRFQLLEKVKNENISDDYIIKYQVGSTNDDGWEDYTDEERRKTFLYSSIILNSFFH